MLNEKIILDVRIKENILPDNLWPDIDKLAKKKFNEKSLIYEEGEDCRFLFLILNGQVMVCRDTYDGICIAFDMFGPGEILGNVFSLTWEKALVVEEVIAALIPKENIINSDYRELNSYLFIKNEEKNVRLKMLINFLHSGTAEEKVLRLLHFFHYNEYFLDPDRYIIADCAQIGAFAAIRRETVSRSLSKLVRLGEIRKIGRKIELLKKKKNN